MILRVLHTVLQYSLTDAEDNKVNKLVDGSFVLLARLHAWIDTDVNSLAEKPTQGGHWRLVYQDRYRKTPPFGNVGHDGKYVWQCGVLHWKGACIHTRSETVKK